MVRREAFRSLGRDQTSSSSIKEPIASPQPELTIAQATNSLHNTHTSNHAAQSYAAYDPRIAEPSISMREMPASTSPNMHNLAEPTSQQLRTKLKTLRIERDETRDGLEKCLSELIATQASLEEKEAEIAKQSIELLTLRDEIARLSTELKEKTLQFSKMEQLSKKREGQALENIDREIRALREEMDNVSISDKCMTSSTIDKNELLDLQRTSRRLLTDLEQKNELLRQKDSALKECDDGWQIKLYHERERLEAELKTKYSSSHAEVREHQLKRQEAEARLRYFETRHSTVKLQEEKIVVAEANAATALSQADFQKSQAETYLQQLRELKESYNSLSQTIQNNSNTSINNEAFEQLKASHAAELEEAHRLSSFFKNNSEQLSRKNREAMASNRSLQESLTVKSREVDEQNSLIQALKMQLAHMPDQYH
jgi:hypothetical protein